MSYHIVLHDLSSKDASSRRELQRILLEEYQCRVVEADLSLENGAVDLLSGLSREQAEATRVRLEKAGAKVLVVRSVQPAEAAPSNLESIFTQTFQGYQRRLCEVVQGISRDEVCTLAKACLNARSAGGTIFILGNGGSAANASHMANDLLKHGHDDSQKSFRVVSLTDNVAWLTMIANDFGYEQLFLQQLRNLLSPRDVVIAISASGNSPNVLAGVRYANERSATTFGIVGFGGGELARVALHVVNIPTKKGEYGAMEDGSIAIGHILAQFFNAYDAEASAVCARTSSKGTRS